MRDHLERLRDQTRTCEIPRRFRNGQRVRVVVLERAVVPVLRFVQLRHRDDPEVGLHIARDQVDARQRENVKAHLVRHKDLAELDPLVRHAIVAVAVQDEVAVRLLHEAVDPLHGVDDLLAVQPIVVRAVRIQLDELRAGPDEQRGYRFVLQANAEHVLAPLHLTVAVYVHRDRFRVGLQQIERPLALAHRVVQIRDARLVRQRLVEQHEPRRLFAVQRTVAERVERLVAHTDALHGGGIPPRLLKIHVGQVVHVREIAVYRHGRLLLHRGLEQIERVVAALDQLLAHVARVHLQIFRDGHAEPIRDLIVPLEHGVVDALPGQLVHGDVLHAPRHGASLIEVPEDRERVVFVVLVVRRQLVQGRGIHFRFRLGDGVSVRVRARVGIRAALSLRRRTVPAGGQRQSGSHKQR